MIVQSAHSSVSPESRKKATKLVRIEIQRVEPAKAQEVAKISSRLFFPQTLWTSFLETQNHPSLFAARGDYEISSPERSTCTLCMFYPIPKSEILKYFLACEFLWLKLLTKEVVKKGNESTASNSGHDPIGSACSYPERRFF